MTQSHRQRGVIWSKKNLFHRGCYVDQWKGAGVSRFSTQNRDSMGSWDNPLVLLLPIALLALYCWWHYIDTLLLLLLLPKTLHTEYKVFATTKSLSYYCRRYRCIYYHNSLPLLRRVFVCLFFVKNKTNKQKNRFDSKPYSCLPFLVWVHYFVISMSTIYRFTFRPWWYQQLRTKQPHFFIGD